MKFVPYEEFRSRLFEKMDEAIPDTFRNEYYVSHRYNEKQKFSDEALITTKEQEKKKEAIPFISIANEYGKMRSAAVPPDEFIDQVVNKYVRSFSFRKKAEQLVEKISKETPQRKSIAQMKGTEVIRKNLFLSAVNYRYNCRIFLRDYPYIKKGDMALFCRVLMENERGRSCITVNHKMLSEWNMDKTEMFFCAAENTDRLFPTVVRKTDAFQNMHLEAYYITNEYGFCGAASIFCAENPLKMLSEDTQNNLIFIPLNIHEGLVIVQENDKPVELDQWSELAESISYDYDVTDPRKEILTTEAYFYNREKDQLLTPDGEWLDMTCQAQHEVKQQNRSKGRRAGKASA